jgi:hypothetical protein
MTSEKNLTQVMNFRSETDQLVKSSLSNLQSSLCTMTNLGTPKKWSLFRGVSKVQNMRKFPFCFSWGQKTQAGHCSKLQSNLCSTTNLWTPLNVVVVSKIFHRTFHSFSWQGGSGLLLLTGGGCSKKVKVNKGLTVYFELLKIKCFSKNKNL